MSVCDLSVCGTLVETGLSHISIQSNRILLEEFPLQSLFLLQKIYSRTIGASKCAQTLKNEGKTSEDMRLLWGEINQQRCEQYLAGNLTGLQNYGNLYKGLFCFMIVGLKISVCYVIKLLQE